VLTAIALQHTRAKDTERQVLDFLVRHCGGLDLDQKPAQHALPNFDIEPSSALAPVAGAFFVAFPIESPHSRNQRYAVCATPARSLSGLPAAVVPRLKDDGAGTWG
jgi:hypothetical protein